MSVNFLNRAKTQANKINTPEEVIEAKKPISPIKPKPVIAAKPGTLSKPAAPGIKPNIPAKPSALNKPGIKPNIAGIKPTTPAPAPAAVEETSGPIASKANPFKIKAKEEVKAEIIPETEEKIETLSEEKITEKVEVESIAESKEVNEPIAEEVKPKTKRKTAKSKTKETTAKKTTEVDEITEDFEEIVIPKTEISYTEAVLTIKSTFADEEWDAFKNDTSTKLGEIQLLNDMTPSALKQTIADLNALRDAVWLHYIDCKTFFETLTAKDDGLLDRIKRLNSKGNNDNERKINAAIALMNYKEGGKSINLYEILDASRSRFNYTKGLMESIQYKSNAVISMLGNLKLEK